MDQKQKLKCIKIGGTLLVIVGLMDVLMHIKAMNNTPNIPIPAVVVKQPESINMVSYITQTGNTVAYNAVNLVARVEGYLDTISFTDGTVVKKGQPLFTIEPKPYQEQLNAAKATVTAQQAAAHYAKAEYARQQRMYKENATSLNNVEKWLAKSHESEAEVAKAMANAEVAAINYGYTQIKAPFDGRIGRHLVDVGNLVGNGVATQLATIEQLDPIYVYFNLNELDLIQLRAAARAHGYTQKNIQHIPVDVSLQNEKGFIYQGKLDFINTSLDASTGTMEFRAILPNKNKILVPGLFVQARVAITQPTLQLTVPDTAILYDQIGAYLLTVNDQSRVVLKRVVLGSLDQEKRAILKGITAQDKVVISGLQNATPGNLVTLQHENTSA